MGVWGPGIYQNDTAEDIKDEFKELYNSGKDVQEITDELISKYDDITSDSEEAPLFWFALADTQWKYGVLLPTVKESAIWWIEHENFDASSVIQMSEQACIKKRKDNLLKLKNQLSSSLPPKRKVAKKRLYKCEWQIGDVFAYRLESELAKEKGLYGKFFLIQKIDEGTWYPGHVVPIVYVKLTNDINLPTNECEYNQLEYVQTSFTKFENRFWPINGCCIQEDILRKSQINYVVDEYGYLPEYRITLLNTSKRVIPKNLIYLGCFQGATPPKNEFIPHTKINISTISWEKYGETFETRMIKTYCNHNLRELAIYKKVDFKK